jgi:hypothetical protein
MIRCLRLRAGLSKAFVQTAVRLNTVRRGLATSSNAVVSPTFSVPVPTGILMDKVFAGRKVDLADAYAIEVIEPRPITSIA